MVIENYPECKLKENLRNKKDKKKALLERRAFI